MSVAGSVADGRHVARASVSRADLLRWLAFGARPSASEAPELALDHGESWFGYVWTAQSKATPVPDASRVSRPIQMAPQSTRRPRRRVDWLVLVTERRPHARDEGADPVAEQNARHQASLERHELEPKVDRPQFSHQELVPRPRLVPALRRHLSALRAGTLDVERLAREIAQRRSIRRLPRRAMTRWNPEIIVLLDFSERLWPFRMDMHRLAMLLIAQCGHAGLSLRVFEHGPGGPWSDWMAHQSADPAQVPVDRSWRPPSAEARVLLVTDLGLLKGSQSVECARWREFAAQLLRQGCQPAALVPLGASQVDTRLFPGVRILRWSPDSRLKPTRTAGRIEPGHEHGIDELLALVAAARRVDPPLLRALRQLNGAAPHDVGLEGALWHHPHVAAGSAACIESEDARERHLARLELLPRELWSMYRAKCAEHHRHLRPALGHEEALQMDAQVGSVEGDRGAVNEATAFVERLAATLARGDAAPDSQLSAYAEGLLKRASARMIVRRKRLFHRLAAEVRRRAVAQGRVPSLPSSIDPQELSAVSDRGEVRRMHLVLARDGMIRLVGGGSLGGELLLAAEIAVDDGGLHLVEGLGDEGRWIDRGVADRLEFHGGDRVCAQLDTSGEHLVVRSVSRPRGAESWGVRRGELWVQTAAIAGLRGTWVGREIELVPNSEVPERCRLAAKSVPALTVEGRPGSGESPVVLLIYATDGIELATLLAREVQACGAEVVWDREGAVLPVDGWANWLERSMAEADATLVLCTTGMLDQFERLERSWPAVAVELLRRATPEVRVVPVVPPHRDLASIPAVLRERSAMVLRSDRPQRIEVDRLVRELRTSSQGRRPGRGAAATVRFGADAEHGVYADVRFAGQQGSATQRFRWIEPGEFMMGSPESEPERDSEEGPQHRVVLTRGFWLGDTACTQGLWTAVMGSNPSRFKGDDRPVEHVSGQEVQEFLSKLEGLLPGCGASLPTEAEWEYACRAGTTTPFSFGENITPEEVNYDGNYPYPGGRKGKYRQETVPVKSLPANAWGLHEMHGNVWEWCRDGKRKYEGGEAVDPVGPEGARAPARVVRGGSWSHGARRARSAYRVAGGPGNRSDFIGFRLSLRSMGSSQARSAEQTQSGSARGAGPRPPGGRPAEPGGRGAQAGSFAARLGRKFGLGGGEHEKDR